MAFATKYEGVEGRSWARGHVRRKDHIASAFDCFASAAVAVCPVPTPDRPSTSTNQAPGNKSSILSPRHKLDNALRRFVYSSSTAATTTTTTSWATSARRLQHTVFAGVFPPGISFPPLALLFRRGSITSVISLRGIGFQRQKKQSPPGTSVSLRGM